MYTCYLWSEGCYLWSGKYPTPMYTCYLCPDKCTTPMYGYYSTNNKNNLGFFWYLLAKLLFLYQVLKHSAHYLKK